MIFYPMPEIQIQTELSIYLSMSPQLIRSVNRHHSKSNNFFGSSKTSNREAILIHFRLELHKPIYLLLSLNWRQRFQKPPVQA